MKIIRVKLGCLCLCFCLSLILASCGSKESRSKPYVTDLDHSKVKRQSIGNCWLYATGSWTESLHRHATGEEVDLSESYWTYWHWYHQIKNSAITEVDTSGSWKTASDLIIQHGMVFEGDFIPEEANLEMSERQATALDDINEQLRSESFSTPEQRTHEKVIAALDQAFHVDMEGAQKMQIAADTLRVGSSPNGDIYLSDYIQEKSPLHWQELAYPRVEGRANIPSSDQQNIRENIFKRVMKALNDKQPVIMSVLVDFNALNIENGRFEREYFKSLDSVPGHQGGHLLVLEDYTVADVPGLGDLGEGDVEKFMQDQALQGRPVTLVGKNSWGSNRPERGLSDGYTRFTVDWLDTPHPWEEVKPNGDYSPLNAFILPQGY